MLLSVFLLSYTYNLILRFYLVNLFAGICCCLFPAFVFALSTSMNVSYRNFSEIKPVWNLIRIRCIGAKGMCYESLAPVN